jgi:hypothetical protein
MEKWELLASSSTEEGVKKIAVDSYFMGNPTIFFTQEKEHIAVWNSRGILPNYRIIKKGKKFRFEAKKESKK